VADQQLLAQRFEEQRGRLRAVAYRMLGSLSEADDAVQEAWLRLSRADTDDVANLPAWLTTVTGRICLDMLRSRTSRREDSLDVHLPDPVISYDDGTDPEGDRLIAVLGFTIAQDKIVAIDVLADRSG
jgi:RNA polymerase sigma factor (sigma-70 family)